MIFHNYISCHFFQALDTICERIQDFTDSAYTSHEHRENILLLIDRIRLQVNQLLRVGVNLVSRCGRIVLQEEEGVCMEKRSECVKEWAGGMKEEMEIQKR